MHRATRSRTRAAATAAESRDQAADEVQVEPAATRKRPRNLRNQQTAPDLVSPRPPTGQARPSVVERVRKKTLEDVLLCVGLNEQLLPYLRPDDLMALRVVNKSIHVILKRYIIYAFSIHRKLAPFFDDPAAFRAVQAQTGAVISGSTALQFFERVTYARSDLDIYVEHCYANQVIKFILENRYKYEPSISGDAVIAMPANHYPKSAIARYLCFTRGGRKIEVMTSLQSPIDIIFGFHSTCVMNIITHQRAYALFPHSTFVRKLALAVHKTSSPSKLEEARQKYIKRGWGIVNTYNETAAVAASREFASGNRWVGDGKTWTIPLTPELPRLGKDTISANSFSLEYDPERNPVAKCFILRGGQDKLRYSYTCSPYELTLFKKVWSTARQGPTADGQLDAKFSSRLHMEREARLLDERQNAEGRAQEE